MSDGIKLPIASSTRSGIMSTGSQTIAGVKVLNDNLGINTSPNKGSHSKVITVESGTSGISRAALELSGAATGTSATTVLEMYANNALAAYITSRSVSGTHDRFSVSGDGSTEPFHIKGANIGMGTAATNPTEQLHLIKAGAVNLRVQDTTDTGGGNLVLSSGATPNSVTVGYVNISGGRTYLVNASNASGANNKIQIGFGTLSSGDPSNTIVTMNQLGDVGIGVGTGTPSGRLHLSQASTSSQLVLQRTGTSSGTVYIGSADGGFRVGTSAGALDMTNISSTGVMSLGGAASQTQGLDSRLYLRATSSTVNKLTMGNTTGGDGFTILYNSSTGVTAMQTNGGDPAAAGAPIQIGSGSDLGVGTAPSARLHVAKAADDIFRIERSGSGGNLDGYWRYIISNYDGGDAGSLLVTPSQSSAKWAIRNSAGATRFLVDTETGFTGVGLSNPAYRFDADVASGGNFVAHFRNQTAATPYTMWIEEPATPTTGYPLLTVTNTAGTIPYLRIDSGGPIGVGIAPTSSSLLRMSGSTSSFLLSVTQNDATAGRGAIIECPNASAAHPVLNVSSVGQNSFVVRGNHTLEGIITNWGSSATQDIGFSVTTGAGAFHKFTSSQRYKYDIGALSFDSGLIYQLNAKEFKWNSNNSLDFGLIAEEVHQVMPQAVIYACDENGLILDENDQPIPEAVKYRQLTVLLIEELKKLKDRIEVLENQ